MGEWTRAFDEYVRRLRERAPVLAAARERIDAECEVPEDVMATLHAASLFRLLLPRSVGGAALAPWDFLAAIDDSIACVSRPSGRLRGRRRVPRSGIVREIFGPADAVLAWGPGPNGAATNAVVVDGGCRVTGP